MTPHHTHPLNRITEIRINTREVFEQACRHTLEVVKATPEADPDLHGLSVDELGWANDQINKARSQVALTLNRLSKRIVHRPQAEQDECDCLIFRVICSTPVQEGLLPEAVMNYMVASVAAAWFRLHPELKTEIDMEQELSKLNHITLLNEGVKRPSQCY